MVLCYCCCLTACLFWGREEETDLNVRFLAPSVLRTSYCIVKCEKRRLEVDFFGAKMGRGLLLLVKREDIMWEMADEMSFWRGAGGEIFGFGGLLFCEWHSPKLEIHEGRRINVGTALQMQMQNLEAGNPEAKDLWQLICGAMLVNFVSSINYFWSKLYISSLSSLILHLHLRLTCTNMVLYTVKWYCFISTLFCFSLFRSHKARTPYVKLS